MIACRLLLLWALLWPAWASAEELRCQELGSVCVCSEPLNTLTYAIVNRAGGTAADPDDSTTKECRPDVSNSPWLYETAANPIVEDSMPAGNAVDYVWQKSSATATTWIGGVQGFVIPAGTRRFCIRRYFMYEPGYNFKCENDSCCDGSKLMQINMEPGGATHSLQMGEDGTNWYLRKIGWTNGPGSDNLTQTGTLQEPDCRGRWCRSEMCLSGNFDAQTGYKAEGYIQQAGPNPNSMQFAEYDLGDPTIAFNNLHVQQVSIVNSARPNAFDLECDGRACTGGCTGFVRFSHAMQAFWPTDSGQWIGEAQEVEGTQQPPAAGSTSSGGSTAGGSF